MKFAPLLLSLSLLSSCALTQASKLQDQKEKCLVKKEGAACHYVGALNIQAMGEAMDPKLQNEYKKTAGEWLRLGCQYKNAESCYEYGNFIAFKSPGEARAYHQRACQLEKMPHCRN